MSDDDRRPDAGVFATAGALGSGLLRLLGVRASYALLELADARDALFRVLLLGAAGLAAGALALVALAALLIVLCWEWLGWGILLILSVAYALLAAWLLQRAARIVADGQLGLPVTLAELQRDREALFGEAADAAGREEP